MTTTTDGERLRLMAVHAHPDDESSKGAATMARYAREGVDVLVVTCTGGERGDILNPAMDRPEVRRDLSAVRRQELVTAINILGVRQLDLGFEDSGWIDPDAEGGPAPLPQGCFAAQPIDVAGRALVELVRQHRPHVLITYDETGGYPHPDHVMCHRVSAEAFDASGDPARYLDAGEPWQPIKMYYVQTFHRERIQALHDAMVERGLESPYAERLDAWTKGERAERTVTTFVPCADYFDVRTEALLAHATQVEPPPHGWWFKVPADVQRDVWPTEDYELARSLVDTSLPEDDLFAGIRERIGSAR